MALSEQGGMYSTKVRCNMKATEGIAGGIIPTTKYITIKDPYKDVKDTVPGRWKSKQFAMDNDPKLCKEEHARQREPQIRAPARERSARLEATPSMRCAVRASNVRVGRERARRHL